MSSIINLLPVFVKARMFFGLIILSGLMFDCSEQTREQLIDGKFSTEHFDFYCKNLSKDEVTKLGVYAEENYARMCSDLLVASTDRIAIHFYYDNAEVRAGANRPDIYIPPWAIGLATASDQIHMISPYHSSVTYDINNIAHEIAHCISMYVNSTIPNRPRWLWESIAIYESGQFKNPLQLDYLKTNPPKTLKEFDVIDNTRIYDVGFLLTEFILDKWGKEKLFQLIKSNGDVLLVLAFTEEEFMVQWLAHLKTKYQF